MNKTKIQWTDTTWNPIRGCSAVSPGCANCYAATMAARFSGPGMPYEGLATREPRARWTGEVRLVPERLADPLRWLRPRRVFVNSMSDLFHESLSNENIAAIFGVMAAAPRHTFQVLTKRAARMLQWFEWLERAAQSEADDPEKHCMNLACDLLGEEWRVPESCPAWPLPNVWLGVSAENQATADERIPLLLQCPAAVRWVSAEPLLGPIRFREVPGLNLAGSRGREILDRFWIVVGGESGPGARPCDVAWIESIVEQCKVASVAVFVKQLGSRPFNFSEIGRFERVERHPGQVDPRFVLLAHSKGGDPAEWPESLRVREYPGGVR